MINPCPHPKIFSSPPARSQKDPAANFSPLRSPHPHPFPLKGERIKVRGHEKRNRLECKLLFAFLDDLVKSPKSLFFVIPVETGIQYFQCLANTLDSRLRGNDDFLRNHLP
jgi:hypothetical protein